MHYGLYPKNQMNQSSRNLSTKSAANNDVNTHASWINRNGLEGNRTHHLMTPNEPARITAKAVSTSPDKPKATQMML